MSDITILMMAANNPVEDSPGRWRAGEIVDVFTLEQAPGPAGHPRHLHVHVTGIPYPFAQIKRRLIQVHDEDAEWNTFRARRRFVVRGDLMPAGARQRLNEDREITVTWEQAKQFAKKRRVGLLDADIDVMDADLDG